MVPPRHGRVVVQYNNSEEAEVIPSPSPHPAAAVSTAKRRDEGVSSPGGGEVGATEAAVARVFVPPNLAAPNEKAALEDVDAEIFDCEAVVGII